MMKLVTRFEAASRTTPELHSLHRQALEAFNGASRGSEERATALASMANIEAELQLRGPYL